MPFSVKVTGDSVLDPAACRGQAAGGRAGACFQQQRSEEACRLEPGWRTVCVRCCLFVQGQFQEGNRLQNFAKGPPRFSSEQRQHLSRSSRSALAVPLRRWMLRSEGWGRGNASAISAPAGKGVIPIKVNLRRGLDFSHSLGNRVIFLEDRQCLHSAAFPGSITLESGFRLYCCQLPFDTHPLKQHAHVLVVVVVLLWFWSYRVEI